MLDLALLRILKHKEHYWICDTDLITLGFYTTGIIIILILAARLRSKDSDDIGYW